MDTTTPASDLPSKQAQRALRAVVVYSPDSGAPGRSFQIGERTLSVGRGDDVAITIRDDRISRGHCSFEWDGGLGVPVVVDHGSSNGTLVNGAAQRRVGLEPGHIIRVGDTLIVIEEVAGEGLVDDTASTLKGSSVALGRLRHGIRTAAPTMLTVLVLGETGTGKELVATEIHRLSNRHGDLVTVNCAAIPTTLAESTLFGHVRGAFTGASTDRQGLFTQADRGTLFLDEVGELAMELQAKLLRVLEDQLVTPVGSSRSQEVDVRVVAATNVALEQAVDDGRFRSDLLARLDDWPLPTPALRDHPVDILPLFTGFIGRTSEITPDVAEALLLHDWPRNVRELGRLARRLGVAIAPDQPIDLTDLPESIADGLRMRREQTQADAVPKTPLTRESIIEALQQVDGNVTQAATVLGCGRKTLYRRLKDFAIDPEKYREE